MGFLDNVFGDDGFVGKLKETIQDTGWFIGAPVATAVDVARAGFDDDVTFGGALATGVNRGTQLFLGDNQGTDAPEDDTENLISPGVQKGLDGLEWLYDNAIAQPINTLNVIQQRGIADLTGTEDNASPFDIGSAWERADEKTGGYDGKGTSIGREWGYSIAALRGNTGALTDEGQKILDEQSKSFDVVSGGIDATSRWFLDPTIVVGKAAKALKFATAVRGVKDPGKIQELLAEHKQFGGLFDGFGPRLEKANDFNMGLDIGAPRSAAEIYMANPGLQAVAGDGWQIAQAMESASRSMWKAGADPDEIREAGKMISLAGLGDPTALKSINEKATEARDAMAAFRSQRDDLAMARDWALRKGGPVALGAAKNVAEKYNFVDDVAERGEDYFSSDEFLAMTNERLKAVRGQFQAAQKEAARVEKIRNMFTGDDSLRGTLAEHPLLSGAVDTGRFGGTKRMQRRAAKEAGTHKAKLDFVFQSSAWNKAVKLKIPQLTVPHLYYGGKAVQAFNRPQAPRTIEFHDENAPLALNNFLKHSAIAPEDREKLVSTMAGARTEGAKRSVVEKAISEAQASMVRKYMLEHPHFDEDTARVVIAEQAKTIRWESDRLSLQTRKFTAHKSDDGTPGDATIDDDGIVSYSPLLETQLENQMVLPDLRQFEKILDRHSGWLNDMARWAKGERLPDQGRIKEVAAKVFDHAVEKRPGLDVRTARRAESAKMAAWRAERFKDDALTMLTKGWKYAVLLRPAYPMRVLVDSDLRAVAKLGPAAFGMHFAPRAFGFATMGGASRIKQHYAAHADDLRLAAAKADLEKFEDTWKASNDGPIESEEYDALRQEALTIEGRLEQYRNGGRAGRRASYGRFGEVGQKDIETVAGSIPGAFADDYGRKQRWLISSKTTAALLGDSEKLAMNNLMTENWVSLTPSDANHMESWLHAVNAQLKQSELGQKAIEFQMRNGDDPERAVRQLQMWMKSTPEGRAIKGRMSWTAANSETHAREIVGYVNHYLPTRELRDKAVKERVTQQDLEAAFPDPELRPPVHGQALAMATGRGSVAGKMINDWFSRTMRWLSDAPEDQLARHPMYAAVYEQEARRQAELLMADPSDETVGLDEIQRLVQNRAHKKAQRAIKTYMFDVATQSDLSHAMRFTSPFIAAWEDTVRKWGRLATDKPDIVGKGYLAWNAPNDMGLVVDKDGKPVESDDFNDETYLLIQAPSWAPFIGGKKLGGADSHFRIPKQAFNIVLQGGLQPGFGPLVAVPTAKLQIANPELDDVANFINPYGPPESVWDAVAPSTVKRVEELVNDQSRSHMYDTERIYMQMLGEYRTDPEKFGGQAPTWEEAAHRAKSVGLLKIVNNFANPFPAIFDSKYKLYQDAYRDLQQKERQDGHPRGWADDQFIKGYGESFFPLVQSMSKNNAGLMATGEAKAASDKYKSEISKYGVEAGAPNKTLIQLIVGPEGEGDYNRSAHRWQETREISPASGVKFRDVSKSQEAAADADADLGWYKYRQFMNTMDAMANDRGLRIYSEDEELLATKREFVENLKEENPAWRVDYDQMDSEKFTRDLEKLGELADSNKFDVTRTDMAGVRQYLVMRQALQQQLEEADVSPGSQDALPFKEQFTEAVMDLAGSNTKFAEWAFHPFLERDPLLADLAPAPTGDESGVDTATQWGF